MQFAGIFHKTSEQMSYALNENEDFTLAGKELKRYKNLITFRN